MPIDSKQNDNQFHNNDTLPTFFVDRVMINHRTDGFNLVRFYTSVPGSQLYEQARIMISDSQMKSMTDLINKLLAVPVEKLSKD